MYLWRESCTSGLVSFTKAAVTKILGTRDRCRSCENLRPDALMCREEAWGDFEKRAEGSVLRVSVKKSIPGLWSWEGARLHCGVRRGNAGVLQEKPRA